MAATKTDSRSQTARARARQAIATELERARKRESKLVAVFSAIDARADAEAALGEALIVLKDLGVAQSDLAEMTGLSAREVGAAIRAAKDRADGEAAETTPDSSIDADACGEDSQSDNNGAHDH
ncbi:MULTISPECIES: hypothetical protein [unclassified Dietzia]|uniref:hypothetical protein n=1 Tax=unclassified Dietzia TaxID=2617939 RepID=UPI001E33CA13|nr:MULTISPECIES: hypothetical protein [unclassified Dietzia]